MIVLWVYFLFIVTSDAESMLGVLSVDRAMTTWMTPSMMQYTLFSQFGAFGFFMYEIEGKMIGDTKRSILQVCMKYRYITIT